MTGAQQQQQQQASKGTAFQEPEDQSSSATPRQIFRTHALQHYMQKNEKNVLPRTISPLVFACCWIALTLTIVAGFLTWSIPVPNYLDTLGIPIAQGSPNTDATRTTTVLVFFPLSAQPYIQPRQAVQVSGNNIDSILTGRITHVDPSHLNTAGLGKQYALKPEMAQFLPAANVFVATVTLAQAIPLHNDTSYRVIVRYQQGTRRALSLLLDLSGQ